MNILSNNHDSTKTLDSQSGVEKKSRFKVKNVSDFSILLFHDSVFFFFTRKCVFASPQLTPEETYHEQQKADATISDPDSKNGGVEDSKELGLIVDNNNDPTKGSAINIPKKSRFTVKTVPKDVSLSH